MKIDKIKDLILYQSENGNVQIEVLYDNEDFWLTQKTMAELFNVAESSTLHFAGIKLLEINATADVHHRIEILRNGIHSLNESR